MDVKNEGVGAGQGDNNEKARFVVYGRVTQRVSKQQKRVDKIVVRAFARELRREALLGEAEADEKGRYRIEYKSARPAKADGKATHLVIRAFTERGTQLGASAVTFNAKAEEEINLEVKLADEPLLSQYESLVERLSPALGNLSPAELNDDDIVFLAGDLGLERQRIEKLRQSARLAREARIPAEILYGLANDGQVFDLERLLKLEPAELQAAIERAVKANHIPAHFKDASGFAAARVEKLKLEKGLLVQHSATVRLIDKSNDKPLTDFVLRVSDLHSHPKPSEIASGVTDEDGQFSFNYVAPRDAAGRRPFELRVHDRQDKKLTETRLEVKPDEKEPYSIKVSLPIYEPTSPKLTELAGKLGLRLTPRVRKILENNGISTLSDVLAKGGLRQLKELDALRDDEVVSRLDKHANLSLLPADAGVNAALIENDYDSIHAIAGSTLKDIEKAVPDKLKATQVYHAAKNQARYLDNLITEYRVEKAVGQASPLAQVLADTELPQECQCKDCQSAVSPLAYLADLLDYSISHIRNGGNSISLNFLQDTFHQLFAKLPASCTSAEEQLRQARIAVEVLRSLSNGPSAEQQAIKVYVFEAYKALLVQLGTSYDELLSATLATPEEREALRTRLAIQRGDGTTADELTRLLLNQDQLIELSLEQIFGLHDTHPAHRLSRGAKFIDLRQQLIQWRLEGIVWGRTTDAHGWVYLTLSKMGNNVAVTLHRHPARTADALIASGSMTGTLGSIVLAEEELSGVSGEIVVNYVEDTAGIGPNPAIVISAVPSFLSWRLNYLRTQWLKQDWPQDPYGDGALPVIDPDVIGPDDLRQTHAGTTEAFDLWLKRRQWVDAQLSELRAQTSITADGQNVPDLQKMRDVMVAPVAYYGSELTPWPDNPTFQHLEDLRGKLAAGQVMEQVSQELEQKLHLTIEGFNRLMAIKDKADAWGNAWGNEAVTEDEWEEVFSLLAQARKRAFFAEWREEEEQIANLFSPQFFWISIDEPQDGVWPAKPTEEGPWIDPDTTKEADIPESVVGDRARQLLAERRNQLIELQQAIKDARESSGSESMFKEAFGGPKGTNWSDELDRIKTDLNSMDPAKASAAREDLWKRLRLSEDEFNQLVAIKAKDLAGQADASKRPTADEWNKLYVLLARAKKERVKFRAWARQEDRVGLSYWNFRKARLPRWRASFESRAGWQRALRARMRVPIVDPDLVALDNLITPSSGHTAYDLWNTRSDELRDRDNALGDARHRPRVINKQLVACLGIADLDGLSEKLDNGKLSTARLEQLNAKRSELGYALKIRKRALAAIQLGAEELNGFYAVLLQIYKRRELFPKWLREERAAGLTLGPDYFQLPQPLPSINPQVATASLNPWRSDPSYRRDWEATLQSRIDQEEGLIEAHWSAVSTVEGATLPVLRDGLIKIADNSTDLDAAAKRLADRFLLDMAVGGCQITTRVSQAIETILVLIWSLRTGQLKDTYPNLELEAEDFDEEWKWLGSYATWRAAMMVFLYPENILLPSLRRQQSPAFRQLVARLRENPRLTPTGAREAAKEYESYFRDVCSLVLGATCEARTWAPASSEYESGQADSQAGHRNLFYMFARSSESKKFYWSTYDLDEQGDYRQTFWAPVPGLEKSNAVRIIGAAPHKVQDGSRYVYLFIEVREPGTNKQSIGYLRYNLEQGTQRWSEELHELPISLIHEGTDVLKGMIADASPIFLCQTAREEDPLLFALQVTTPTSEGALIIGNELNADGNDWLYEQWRDFGRLAVHRVTGRIGKLICCLARRVSWTSTLFFFRYPNNPEIRFHECSGLLNEYKPDDFWEHHLVTFPDADTGPFHVLTMGEWKGAIGQADGIIYAFVSIPLEWNDQESEVVIKLNYSSTLNNFTFQPPFVGPGRIPIHCGQLNSSYINFVGRPPLGSFLTRLARNERYDQLTKASSVRVQPLLPQTSIGGTLVQLEDATRLGPLGGNEALATRSEYESFVYQQSVGLDVMLLRIPPSRQVRTYFYEAYYFLPVLVALSLCKSGEYLAALDWFRNVYNYSAPREQRRIFFGLRAEEGHRHDLVRLQDWLLDPLNPHEIAATRANTYTRFTLLSLIRCLLDYADAEFTQDTIESNARARSLYGTALELLDEPELKQSLNVCDRIIGELIITVGAQSRSHAAQLASRLRQLDSLTLVGTANQLKKVWANGKPVEERLGETRRVIAQTMRSTPASATFGDIRKRKTELAAHYTSKLLRQSSIAAATRQIGMCAADRSTLQYVYQPTDKPSRHDGTYTLSPTQASPVRVPSYHFCVPPNPLIGVLRLRAELNLYKLRHCLNIAGLERQLEPYAAPTDTASGLPSIGDGGQLILPGAVRIQPTQYRYKALIERARQLAGIAQQMEATFLSLLERLDAEDFNLLKARQDARAARAGVRLQDLRVREADDGVELARRQRQLWVIQDEYYMDLLTEGLLDEEELAVNLLWLATGVEFVAAAVQAGGAIAAGFAVAQVQGATSAAIASAVLDRSGSALSSIAGGFSSWSSVLSVIASQKRRVEDWHFQQDVAQQNILIGNQQIILEQNHVRVVGQDREIAVMEAEHADEVVEFLNSKFTGRELYDWMSGILEGVYRYFLQQTAAVARLAENQLAFERQQVPPALIQSDYWSVPDEGIATETGDGAGPDRRGLTGSARLLQDIYRLDQYAFETDQRKLQLTKTISLARLDPVAFQRFRQTGVMSFTTPMEIFDRDFPGHYLRLVKRVRTSVIALIPPTEGIKATLTTLGISRVVIGSELFQTTIVNRGPESVALTSPINATGLFELEAQSPSEMLFPFEGLGVDTSWELRMPQAANQFDYNTIADVLLTIEYTALNSFLYQQQVIQQLNRNMSADRPFSFRHQFADQWYDFNNADLIAAPQQPMVVRFRTRREDFPPNVEELKIQHVTLYIACKPSADKSIEVRNLRFTEVGVAGEVGGSATSVDGLLSTRQTNAASWTAMIGKSPIGDWELALPDTQEMRDKFKNGEIEDILFVITFSGTTPEWPS